MATQHQLAHYQGLAAEALVGVIAQSEQMKRARYVSALRSHDWTYEYSDEIRIFRRGQEEREELRRMQREIDPDGVLWRANAPSLYREAYL